MQEVTIDEYRKRERRTERFLASEDERQEMPYQKLGLAAIATVGALALGYRTGAMRKVAHFLDVEGRAAIQAAKEVLDQEGSLTSDLSRARLQRIKQTYSEKRNELRNLYHKQPEDILERREFDMERYLRQREQLIQNDVPYNINEGLRFQAIMQDIRNHPSISNELADQIELALGKGHLGILRTGSKNDVQFLLKNKGINDKNVVHLVNEIRKRHKGTDFITTSEEGLQWVEGMQKKLRELTAREMMKLTRRDGKIRQMIIGHRQATIQDILDLKEKKLINVNADLMALIRDAINKNKDFAKAIFDEKLYVQTKNGKVTGLVDYKVFDQINRKHLEWWSHTIPGSLIHLRDILNIKAAKEQASFRIFQRGTIQPMLNAHRGFDNKQPLADEVVYVAGKLVRLFDADAINNDTTLKILNPDRDMYITSARYGKISKISRHVAGLMTGEERKFLGKDLTNNKIAKALDLFAKDRDADFVENVSILTKFFNNDWQRKKVMNAIRHGIQNAEEFYDMKRYFSYYNEGFSPRTLNQLKPHLPEYLQEEIDHMNINFSRDEDILKLFTFMGEDKEIQTSYDYNMLFKRYQRNPDEVLGQTRPIEETNPIIGGNIRVQTGMDQIKQQVSMELIRQITQVKPAGMISPRQAENDLRNLFHRLNDEGKILKKDRQTAEWLLNQYMFESAGKAMYNRPSEALESVSQLFTGEGEAERAFQFSMKEMVKKREPLWGRYSKTRPINQIGDEYILVNKAFQSDHLLGRVTEFFTDFADKSKQLGLRTGRRNMEDFTTLSIFGSYYPIYRLSDALSSVGLGLSDESMGSPLQFAASFMLKRIFPLFGAVALYQYADYEVDKYTGAGISDRWENYKAYRRLEEAQAREQFGTIDQLKHELLLKPGLDHFASMPSIHIPLIGEVGPGKILNEIFGLGTGSSPLSDKQTMNVEETYQDITEGTEPIRKGRWWAFGSKTAYRGGRISEFAPNSYRLAQSDWEYTNVTGTGDEIYTNTLMPTFENAFGLKHLLGLTDPYWWEKKHYYDRPYLLTGDLFNSNTPFIGDIGNMIIGQLIKPTRQMHMEYWGNPELVQERSDKETEGPPDSPVVTRISPSGRVKYTVYASSEAYGGEDNRQDYEEAPVLLSKRELNSDTKQVIDKKMEPYKEKDATPPKQYILIPRQNAKTGKPTGDVLIYDTESNEAIYMPSRMQGEYKNIDAAFKAAKAAEDQPPKNAKVKTEPRGLYAPVYEYQKNVDRRKLQELQDPRSKEWKTQELASNWLEPHGVYNWILIDEFMKRDPYDGQMVIEKADKAYNASNAFWEQELGSLGGELSEIGRRFIRRDSGMLDTYNPIRNTMPDWLPGSDYFINFKEGDPYSKIPHGEYRLPGEAYERLNKLHPDETGRYGAFDKFKILADVAPWSDEYKFWRDYVTTYITDPELRKQAAKIKKQVAKRKRKYEFQDYIFKTAQIDKMKVTVTKFLDDYTFLTKEFGDQPFRLAGVDVRAKAPGVLQHYIHVGDKITIGVDADESKRVQDDTYSTIKAVVFRGIESLNREIIERGEMKESQTDFSAPGVWARFSPAEISKGQRWETIAHFESALNTKFLQVRSPLEEYERDQIYGKDWATWRNFGISDYLIPALDRMKGNESILNAGLSGLFIGGFIGRIFLGGGKNTKYGAVIGALTGVFQNLMGKYYQHKTGERWIPERRRKEQEINEYFDILKYIKYNALYEKAKQELHHMGYDADKFLEAVEKKKEETKKRRQELEKEKRELFIKQPRGWEKRKKEINQELQKITEEWDELKLPEPVAQALAYKEERDTTLYAIDPYEDRMKVLKAFPYKDKWFFNEFAEAREEDRPKILSLVPENERRIYKAIWGLGLEKQKPLEYYAKKYNIPDKNWAGWLPEVNLEDIKLKVVQREGLDLSDFNYWSDDVEASQYVPDIPEREYKRNHFKGYHELAKNIREVMEGQGLHDVQVVAKPSYGSHTRVRIHYEEDRSKEIENEFKYNMNNYLQM